MPDKRLLIVNYDDLSHVICTHDDLDLFHLYNEATGEQTWEGVMNLIGKENFLRLWQYHHSETRLTNGSEILFEPKGHTSEDESFDLTDHNTWKYSDESPLSSFAFSKLVDSRALSDSIIKELGGHQEYLISGTYFTKSPEEIQDTLSRHGIEAEIVAEIPYEIYNSDRKYVTN